MKAPSSSNNFLTDQLEAETIESMILKVSAVKRCGNTNTKNIVNSGWSIRKLGTSFFAGGFAASLTSADQLCGRPGRRVSRDPSFDFQRKNFHNGLGRK